MDFRNSAIAIATDDGIAVSSHFGQARYYDVLYFAGGKVTKRERREKAGHHSLGPAEEGNHDGETHEARHRSMVSPIPECQAVIVRGMGEGAVHFLRRSNLVPVLTELRTIDEVIEAVAAGTLESDPGRIHLHHGQ